MLIYSFLIIFLYVFRPRKFIGYQSRRTPTSTTASLNLVHCHSHKVKPFSSPFSVTLFKYIKRQSYEKLRTEAHLLKNPFIHVFQKKNPQNFANRCKLCHTKVSRSSMDLISAYSNEILNRGVKGKNYTIKKYTKQILKVDM